ncbi:MAG: flagellar motor protein MotB [Planctomycetota bacterium]|nr:flagellar motor protein MotB [Planctomycetota bacterium]
MSEHEHKEGHEGGGSHGGGGGHAPHGGGHEEGHEGAPEWLISFADMVMLIMGFFVILLAMNMQKNTAGGIGGEAEMGGAKSDVLMEFVLSVREGFNNPVDLKSKRPEDQALIRYLLRRSSGTTSEDAPSGGHNKVQSLPAGTKATITGVIPFDDRSTVMGAAERAIAVDLATRLKDQRWVIEVRGHVSPFEVMHNPVRARQLSYERAQNVGLALVESGVRWEALRLVACGDGQRVVPRAFDRDEDRTNQRVEIIVTTDLIPDDPYARPAGTPRQSPDAASPAPGDAPAPAPEPRATPPGGHSPH